jgi:predicted RNA-binding protein YlxR (DUF448 family)
VSGESQPKGGLIRFCVAPDDTIVPDIVGRLPGRGIYVQADCAAIDKAASKGLFSRAAKRPVKSPEGLSALVETLLARRVVDLISMARKASGAVTGFEKVKEWLVKGKAVLLIQASDGSEREAGRLRPPPGEGRHLCSLTAGELGLAFGRERAIHAALSAGGITTRVVEEAARLAGLRPLLVKGSAVDGPLADRPEFGGPSAGKDK